MQPARQTDRAFGLGFAGISLAVAVAGRVFAGAIWIWPLGLAAGLLAAAWLRPGLLGPLNAVWRWIAGLVGRVNSALVLGVIFYAVLTPIGLLLRLLAGDPMARAARRGATTYLGPVRRQVTRETLADQF